MEPALKRSRWIAALAVLATQGHTGPKCMKLVGQRMGDIRLKGYHVRVMNAGLAPGQLVVPLKRETSINAGTAIAWCSG